MQVRVFESDDMTSGLKKIRKELGPDALILSTKTVRSNGFGRSKMEITAAIDDIPPLHQTTNGEKASLNNFFFNKTSTAKAAFTQKRFRHVVDDNLDEFLSAGFDNTKEQRETPPSAPNLSDTQPSFQHTETPEPTASKQELQEEIKEIRKLIGGLSQQMQQLATQTEKIKTPMPKIEAPAILRPTLPSPLQRDPLLSRLLEREIECETARTIVRFLRDNYSAEELLEDESIEQKLIGTLENLIEVATPQFSSETSQQRIAFVGPTGVGKTTTLAKVCAHYVATQSNSVALITIDTYRIAAVEQLKIYGEIMGLPVDVVFTPEQMEQTLLRHQDKDLILIDTAGRSPRDLNNIDELASFFRPEFQIDKHLVLSAATKEKELLDIISTFRRLGLHRTVFTKLDECFTLGVVLNVQLQNLIPLSWLTNGQRVPEDLLHISPKEVAELIMIDGKATDEKHHHNWARSSRNTSELDQK